MTALRGQARMSRSATERNFWVRGRFEPAMTERSRRFARTRPVARLASAGLLVALLVPSAASAATWTTRSQVAFPDSYRVFQDTYGGAIAWFSPAQGGGVFGWETPGLPATSPGTTFVPLREDGSLGGEIKAPGTYLGATADAKGEITVLVTGPAGSGRGELLPRGVFWRRYGAAGELVASGQLSAGRAAIQPALAANSRGDLVAVWLEGKRGKFQLRAATRGAESSGFGAPVELGSDPSEIGLIAADVSDDGRLVVAYEASLRGASGKRAREAAPKLTAWTGTIVGGVTARQAIGRRDRTTSVDAAFDGLGRGYVVWQGTGGGNARPQLATVAPGAAAFSAPVDLDPHRRSESEPMLATDQVGGGAVVAWTRAKTYPVIAATIDADGQLGSRQTVGTGLPVAAATSGGVSAVAVDVGEARSRIAVRDRGTGRFGKLERPAGRSLYADSIRIVVEPSGQLRVTGEITDESGQARVLTLLRAPAP